VNSLNPSKRYTKEIAEREGKALAVDVTKALEKKYPNSEKLLDEVERFGKEFFTMNKMIESCEECRISYSNGKIDGFCPNHADIAKRFQNLIDQALR
jgi:hypothetical protein